MDMDDIYMAAEEELAEELEASLGRSPSDSEMQAHLDAHLAERAQDKYESIASAAYDYCKDRRFDD